MKSNGLMGFLISYVQIVQMDIIGILRIKTAPLVINGLLTVLNVISMKVALFVMLVQMMISTSKELRAHMVNIVLMRLKTV